MWIFTTRGFYSVVADAEKPGHVLIRARAKRDAWNLYRDYHKRYPMRRPKADERRDYRWRTGMLRKDFARLATALAREITYHNFKDEVHHHTDQENKTEPYMKVWAALLQVQLAEGPAQQFRFTPDWMLDSAAERQAEKLEERRYYRRRERELFGQDDRL
jgi:hypothetical protein